MDMKEVGKVYEYQGIFTRCDSTGKWIAWMDEGEVEYYKGKSKVKCYLRPGMGLYYMSEGPEGSTFHVADQWVTIQANCVFPTTAPLSSEEKLLRITKAFHKDGVLIECEYAGGRTKALLNNEHIDLGCTDAYHLLMRRGILKEIHKTSTRCLAMVNDPGKSMTLGDMRVYTGNIDKIYGEVFHG
jgi:hypothetical protein